MRRASCFFFFSSRRRHTRWPRDWSSDVCSSDLDLPLVGRIDDGCIVSTGYFRHGILLAPLGGRVGAELAIGRRPDWLPPGALDSVSPQRFETPADLPVLSTT